MLLAFDHVNLLTDDLEGMAQWYETVLQLKRGPRPAFSVPGVWLYLEDKPLIHLVETKRELVRAPVSMEHFAFRAKGIVAFEEGLDAAGINHSRAGVPGTDIVQVNFYDPMGNHIHVDFCMADEEAGETRTTAATAA